MNARPRLLLPALLTVLIAAVVGATASPVAMAENQGQRGPSAERLIRAADAFDKRADAMRGRSSKLRAAALALRLEAEELLGSDDETIDPAGEQPGKSAARNFGHREQGAGGDEGDSNDDWDEARQLLKLADRLERRATALAVAADRMAGHAAKLRERAAAMLKSGGANAAQRMLARAKALRAQATAARAKADELRDTAFQDDAVDEDVVAQVERLETRAARMDGLADRFEAKAAKLSTTA